MGYIFQYLPNITKTENFLLYLVMHLDIIVDLLYVDITYLYENNHTFQNRTLLRRVALY